MKQAEAAEEVQTVPVEVASGGDRVGDAYALVPVGVGEGEHLPLSAEEALAGFQLPEQIKQEPGAAPVVTDFDRRTQQGLNRNLHPVRAAARGRPGKEVVH